MTTKLWNVLALAGTPTGTANIAPLPGSPHERENALRMAREFVDAGEHGAVFVEHVLTGERIFQDTSNASGRRQAAPPTPDEAVDELLALAGLPESPRWLRNAASELKDRDPVKAAGEAEALSAALGARANRILSASIKRI